MKFREQLEKAKELGLRICDLTVANECDCVFNFDYTAQEFECLCGLAVYVYLKEESLTAHDIASAINDLIEHGDYTVYQVLEMSNREFIELVVAGDRV